MRTRLLIWFLLGIAAMPNQAVVAQQSALIRPGAVWHDTQGQEIQAHGGGILRVRSTFYWFGEDRGQDPASAGPQARQDASKRYVSCYTSKDLAHWTRHPDALVLADPEHLGPQWVLERPKVYPGRQGRPFVMYFHLDDRPYRLARVAVAVSRHACGPYHYVRSFRPLGQESRDIGQFIDDNGTGYLLFESRPTKGFFIARLTPDYMHVAGQAAFLRQPLEADTLTHLGSWYYVLGSHMTGWRPNPDVYAVSHSISGPWSSFANIAAPGVNTYDSQPTMLLKVQGTQATSVLYMGDIWRPGTLWDSRYLWMPLEIGEGKMHLPAPAPWSIDVKTGRVHTP